MPYADPEKRRECKRASYEANREVVLERQRAYRAANAEKVREYNNAYYAANAERIRERCRAYRATSAGIATAERWAAKASTPIGDRVGTSWTPGELIVISDPALTYVEMASITGRSINSIRVRVRRERQKGNLA